MRLRTKIRNKNHLFIQLIVVCIIFLSLTINLTAKETINAQDTIWYVGGNGPGNFSTIQDAINNASAGDTIFVFNGTYYENIIIDISIDLKGASNTTTVIDGRGLESVLRITADNVEIQDFTIKNAKNTPTKGGISIITSDNINISNNLLIDNPWFGIIIRGPNANNIRITNNKIMNNRYGTYLIDSQLVIISNNTFNSNDEGIYLVDSDSLLINNNTIFMNNQGIHCEQITQSIFYQNDINNNGNGCFLFNSTNNQLQNNSVINNRWYGIWLRDSSFNNLTKNYVNENIDYGVFLDYSDYNIIFGNIITNNDDGIYLEYSSYTIVKSNILKNDKLNAYFTGNKLSHFNNQWKHNFWDRPRYLPYIIPGQIKKETRKIPLFSFDIKPLKNPSQIIMSTKKENTIWYVGGSGPGNYTKIQDAVDNASSGDTIYVFNNTYYETIYINKKLSIIGEKTQTTIIEGNGTRDILIISADEVIISDFTIQNGHFGIQYLNVSNGIIHRNEILACLHGMTLRNCSNIQIINNSFNDNQYGIRLYTTTRTHISYNVFNSYKLEGFFLGTTLAHSINFWKYNYWHNKEFPLPIIWGKLWFGNYSILWFNIDFFPLS